MGFFGFDRINPCKPTNKWIEVIRPNMVAVHGEEWMDWELLIDTMIREHVWSHPSRWPDKRQYRWVLNSTSYDMTKIDWTIMTSKEWAQIKNIPPQLIKYQVLMM